MILSVILSVIVRYEGQVANVVKTGWADTAPEAQNCESVNKKFKDHTKDNTKDNTKDHTKDNTKDNTKDAGPAKDHGVKPSGGGGANSHYRNLLRSSERHLEDQTV